MSSPRVDIEVQKISKSSKSKKKVSGTSHETSREPPPHPKKINVNEMTEESEMETAESYQNLFNILEKYENIVFDLGDVILDWDSTHETSITMGVNDLRKLLCHPIWQDLERGVISRKLALTLLSSELQTPYEKLNEILELSIASLRANNSLLSVLKTLHQKNKKILCVSNIDMDSFLLLFRNFEFWGYFDSIYVSSLLQLRKPNSDIFEYIVSNSSLRVEDTVFVDDKVENLKQAAKLGLNTVKYSRQGFTHRVTERQGSGKRKLLTTVDENRRKMGRSYLNKRLRDFPLCRSCVGNDVELIASSDFSREIFSTAVILHSLSSLPEDVVEAMSQEMLKHDGKNKLRWCFYKNEARPAGFPDDLDTTSMILSFLVSSGKMTKEEICDLTEEMISNRNKDGIIQVYFDDTRPRVDAIVATNVLYLLNQVSLGSREELVETEDFIFDFLTNDKYLEGTRYYPAPDVFLFFLSRLVVDFPGRYKRFSKPLSERLISRVDLTPFPLERALRVIAMRNLGIINRTDFLKLMDSQLEDGGWPMYGLFIAPTSNTYFGSRELSSSFALEAMNLMN
ncbi:putative HAD-superfamily hydrolase subfamily IA, variant 3 [Rhodobacteraceae bacterium KLH11]|nr:putative HAD-superfamily hydrolase subfamily IA, variant 3 [Rhodobacteraceae bacterium KLH11]